VDPCYAGRRVTRITETIDTTYRSPFEGNATMCLQSLRVGMDLITKPVFNHRSTKIIATIGVNSGTQDQLLGLLDSGVNVVRFDLGDEHNLVSCRAIRACAL
jgi:pyruvate kinase